VDVAVVTAAPGGQEVVLPRAPRERLDGSVVVRLCESWGAEGARVPDADEVVVAARGELGAVGAPLEAADLARVDLKVGRLVLGDADVVVEDPAVAGAGRENVLVPC